MAVISEEDILTQEEFIHKLSLQYLDDYKENYGSPYHWEKYQFSKKKGFIEVQTVQQESDRVYYRTLHVNYENIYDVGKSMVGETFERCVAYAASRCGDVVDSEIEIL